MIDFQAAQRHVAENRLSGRYVSLRRVRLSRSLRILNASQAELTDELIRLYFESKHLPANVDLHGDVADLTFETQEGGLF